MRTSNVYLLIFLVGISFITFSFTTIEAQVVKDGLYQTARNDFYYEDGVLIKSIHTLNERILDYTDDRDHYVDSRIFEDANIIQVETYFGSVILDKNTCGYSYFNKGKISNGQTPLFTDSIIPHRATINTDVWQDINVIINADCNAYLNGNELIAEKKVANAGTLQYKYIMKGNLWKTKLVVINESTLTDQKFGFTQTIDLNRDTINYGGQVRNLDNFDGMDFDKDWIDTNESQIINLLNSVHYDFDLAHSNLWNIHIQDTGVNKSKLSFNFVTNSTLLPNEKLVLDPTWSEEYSYGGRVETLSTAGATCSSTANLKDVTPSTSVYLAGALKYGSGANPCHVGFYQFDITGLDLDVITQANFNFDVATIFSPRTCDVHKLTSKPSTASAQTILNEITSGTVYVNTSACQSTGSKSVNLGSSAITDIEAQIGSGWFALGFDYNNMGRDPTQNHRTTVDNSVGSPNPTLELLYMDSSELELPRPPSAIGSDPQPIGTINLWWDASDFDGTDQDATDITNYFLGYSTIDFGYQKQSLPTNILTPSLKDFNYSQGYTGRLDLTGLDSLWQFDTLPNLTNVTDGTGNQINLTLSTEGEVIKGKFGKTVALSEDYFNFTDSSNSITGTTDFAFGTWFNATSSNTRYGTLLAFDDTNNFEVRLGDDSLAVYSGATEIKNETMAYTTDTWNHIMITRESNDWEFFYNGVELGSDTTYGTSIGSAFAGNFTIGVDASYHTNWFNGTLDDMFIGDSTIASQSPNSFWQRGNQNWDTIISLGNVTSYSLTGLDNGQLYYLGVFSSTGQLNSSYSAITNATTPSVPDTPTLSALTVSFSQIDMISTAGVSDHGDPVKDYGLRCEINKGTGWLDTISNSTLPANRSYNYTGLSGGDLLTCQWRDGNGVGWSEWSINATSITFGNIEGTFNFNYTQVGDAIGVTPYIQLTNGVPDPTLSAIRFMNGSTTIISRAIGSPLIVNGSTDYFNNFYKGKIGTTPSVYSLEFDITNSSGTFTFDSLSDTGSIIRLFKPDYLPSFSLGLDDYNYTLMRTGSNVNLNVTRAVDDFILNCQYLHEGNLDGSWRNESGKSYFEKTYQAPNPSVNVYGRCYNPNSLVFSFNSFGNTTGSVLGLLVLDSTLGNWLGVPIVSMFVLLLASIATKSTSYMFSIFLLVAIGILGGLGLVVMDSGLWALIMITGTLTTIGTKLGVG